MSFEHEEVVRFGHVDAAGIVFYPRYFEMLNATIEAWFAEALSYPFQQMVAEGCGIPLVASDVRFSSASRLGEHLRFLLGVRDGGGASIELEITCLCAGETRLTATLKLVLVQLQPFLSKRIPDELRSSMIRYLERPC